MLRIMGADPVQQRYTAVLDCKGGKARQELTGVYESILPCKPYPMQRRLVAGITRLLGAPAYRRLDRVGDSAAR